MPNTVDPQEPGKVIGYNTAQPAQAVDIVNTTKSIENDLGDWIAQIRRDFPAVNEEWLETGRKLLQQGFMALNRAVFQPESRL